MPITFSLLQPLVAHLPITAALPALCDALQQGHEAVLEAPPGAGKTTVVPLTLLTQAWLGGQKILLLEPRRLAAKAAAERMAALLGEAVGETVGYRMRLETRVSARTRIEVVTEGILTRLLQNDPALEGVGLVIFDEFHERSLEADLALALTLYARDLFRDTQPLKVLAMSATLDGDAVARLLGQAPVIQSAGRQFEVLVRYHPPGTRHLPLEQQLTPVIMQALEENTASLLVFLPGQGEIRRLAATLATALAHHPALARATILAPLYGDLDLAHQQQAIAPAPAGQRKIVLATSIAETSLTIEGIQVVIDSGLSRLPVFDPNTALTRLHTVRVSQAASEQRRGRAGRLTQGVCYRCWAEHEQLQLPRYSPPEILQADLAALALQLKLWGVTPEELRWLSPPPASNWAVACALLQQLGALDEQQRLTPHGTQMARFPVHPRLAHMLICGQQQGLADLACDLAALLGERDLLAQEDTDLRHRLACLAGELRVPPQSRGQLQRIRQQRQRYRALLADIPAPAKASIPIAADYAAGLLLAFAYPDRIARQRQAEGTSYLLANGRAGSLRQGDSLCRHPWLVVADLGSRQGQREEQIYLAAPLDEQGFWGPLRERVSVTEVIAWDDTRQQLQAETQHRIGKLLWRCEPLDNLSPDQKRTALLGAIRRQGLEVLPWNEDSRQLQARIECLRTLALPALPALPDSSDAGLLATLEDWLGPFIDTQTQLRQLQSLDLRQLLLQRLDWTQRSALEQWVPACFEAPTGSKVAIDYRHTPPVLAIKLQELFGLTQTPAVAQGRLPLLLHLLSPARRPVQVTANLGQFWQSSYHEVKKELKGRYPRHPWPDDPLGAPPAKGTKKQELRNQER